MALLLAHLDINLTSAHSLYRDRLASAYLIGIDTRGDVDIEEDLDLAEICRHEADSKAPYHLINTALNLQGSTDIGLRDRKSDFFIFSKNFIGGERTGYCRSGTMEQVHPEMGLSTAMAISAAAASPAMGRMTSPLMSAIMALLNVRLGYWVPNPGLLEEKLAAKEHGISWNFVKRLNDWWKKRKDKESLGFQFEDVFWEELREIRKRWSQLQPSAERKLSPSKDNPDNPTEGPTLAHNLVGLAFSGGGIRSATINLGIAQALHKCGVFDHVDYMSTVSGGGYLGASLSALMRRRTPTVSEVAGTITYPTNASGKKEIFVKPGKPAFLAKLPAFIAERLEKYVWPPAARPKPGKDYTYTYESDAVLLFEEGKYVKQGQRLIDTRDLPGKGSEARTSFADRMRWRVRPVAFVREMLGLLDERHRWVNVSDGGHIENLATIELLRRRCRYIIIGDGEADPKHHFSGLATLIRLARIDLSIDIRINLKPLELNKRGLCKQHWVLGTIHYPGAGEKEMGYLLYLKSSLTGDEDVVIQEYRNSSPSFPHESTADQSFTEGQFEAYRSLGQHIAEKALNAKNEAQGDMETPIKERKQFKDLNDWFQELEDLSDPKNKSTADKGKTQFETPIKVPPQKDSLTSPT